MMNNKLILALSVLFSLPAIGYSQTVSWATPPVYESLEEYTGDLYKIREHGKVGLADISGKILVSADYDSITPFNEFLALALEYAGGKYAVKGIINQHNYSIIQIPEKYYVTDKYPFFSEGKLVVYDAKNKYGYLQADGSLFKSCQYIKTYPFYSGLACIHKKENEVAYLQSTGNELTTELENDGYILLTGSSFNEEGEAYVQGKAVGVKRYIIDTKGRIVREAKFSGKKLKNYEYRKPFSFSANQDTSTSSDGVNAFSEGGKYGFSSNNHNVLPPQFSEAGDFRGGYAKVKMNGKWGILKLHPGSFSGRLNKDIAKVENGKVETVNYLLSTPSVYANKIMIVQMNQEGDVPTELESVSSVNSDKSYAFNPVPQNKEKEMICHFSIQADGILLWEDSHKVAMQHVVYRPPILSVPQVGEEFKIDEEGYVRADSNNKVDIYATIENKSSETVYVTLTIGGNGTVEKTKNVSIAPGSSARISTSINAIKERKPVEVFVKTSTGLKQSKVIKVKPFI